MAKRLGCAVPIRQRTSCFLRPRLNHANTSGMRSLVAEVLIAVPVVLGVAASSRTAVAGPDSVSDMLGPREIAVGEALRGAATGSSGTELNPSSIGLNRELVFEGGYGYRGADSASLIGVSACDSTNALPGCFFYDYAGSNPQLGDMTLHRTTHVAGVALSRMVVPRVLIGATARYYDFSSDMAGDTSGSGTTFDLGATVRLTNSINFGFSGQNLYSTTRSPEFPRTLGGGLYARPVAPLALSFDARWRVEGSDRSARFGGGADLFLSGSDSQDGYSLRGGALHDNGLGATYLSAGLGFASMSWGLDVAGRRQVKGGDETLIIASMRVFGPRLPASGVE